jgi:hypothetical protein
MIFILSTFLPELGLSFIRRSGARRFDAVARGFLGRRADRHQPRRLKASIG